MLTVYAIFFFVIGTVLGSFYNVVGYRVPKKQSIVYPPSHCTKCKKRLGILELIPIFSFLFLGGKCKKCKKEISIIYPYIELLTGLLFFTSYMLFGLSIELAFSLLFISFCIIVMVSDLRYMIIPDEFIIIFLIAITIVRFMISGFLEWNTIILDSIIPFAFIFLVKEFGDALFKKETLGGGDIKLMLIVGVLLGWSNAIIAVFLGAILAFPIAIYYFYKDKKHMLPFGPYLCIAALFIHYIGMNSLEIIKLLY
jgi:leader peptidase (prepilin peptidase)/N-methyltransferase